MVDKTKIIVGLDLGTDKCCLTYQDNIGRPFIITDDKQFKISSIIGILNNGILVGNEISKEYNYDIPIITNLKRLIGHTSIDHDALDIASFNGWKLLDDNDNMIIMIGKNMYKLVDLMCVLLKKIKQIIISNIGENFSMIITVPANFNEGQKNQILQLCKLVGIDCKRLIYEPCSAALAYINYFDQTDNKIIDQEEGLMKRIMVFDFGAGTLDLAIVTCNCIINNGEKEWLAKIEFNIGDNHLGGIDIDMMLGKYLENKFPDFKKMLDLHNESMNFIIEKIKIKLSNLYKSSNVSLVERYYDKIITINIQEYFNLLDKNFKDRIIHLLDELHQTNIKQNEIDTILLIGGSCYNPWIKNLLSMYYSKNIKDYTIKLSDHFNTYNIDIKDIGVSLGATCVDKKTNVDGDTLILTESLPLSIGIGTVNNQMCKILPKNTLIPCTAKKYFTTSEDNQTKIEVKLFQGECDDVTKNFFLGSFSMNDLPQEPQGKIVVIINVSVTTDNLITVEGKVKNIDKCDKKIIINRYDIKIDNSLIESNINNYEINDLVFNNIMGRYYELITMLNRLQYNLIDNISCHYEKSTIDNILTSFWDDLILLYKLMSESNKIKPNIQQLDKFIKYISTKMDYKINDIVLDVINDNIIASKLDKLNKFINKNLQHLVSAYQIKTDGISETLSETTKYDTLNDTKLIQINSINNPTEILTPIEKHFLDGDNCISEIRELTKMIVDDIECLQMPDHNKLLLIDILDKFDTYLDNPTLNGLNSEIEYNLLQNMIVSLSNINDQQFIEKMCSEISTLNDDEKSISIYKKIINNIIGYNTLST